MTPRNRVSFGTEAKATSFNDDWGLMTGLRGDWYSNRSFSVGVAGYVQTTELFANDMLLGDDGTLSRGRLEGWYGGVTTGYSVQPTERSSVAVNNLFGIGNLRLNEGRRGDDGSKVDDSTVFALEPGVTASYNITERINVGLGGSYRFIVDSDLRGFDNQDLSGPAANFMINFGR